MKAFLKNLFFLLFIIAVSPRVFAQGTPVIQYDFTGAGSINTQNLNSTGTATVGSAVTGPVMNNANTITVQVTGTYTGAISVQVSLDGTNWVTVTSLLNLNTGVYVAAIPSAATGIWQAGVEGVKYVQVTGLAAMTGTAVVTYRVSASTATVGIDTPIPAGTNLLGAINLTQINGNAAVAPVNGVLAVEGNVAQGGAPTASPVLVGGITLSTVPAAAIANNLTQRFTFTGDQQLITHLNGDPSQEWQATSGITALATTTSTQLTAAGGAGIRNYVTDIHITNNSATTATIISILDGSTVIWTSYLPLTSAALQSITVDHTFITPLKGTAATAMNIQCGTAGAAVYYNVSGFKNN